MKKITSDGQKLNYQFVFFGAFPEMIFDNPETVLRLTQIFTKYGFIPTTIQNVNIESGIVNTSQKISLGNKNGWSITLDTNRIDITIAFDDELHLYNAQPNEIIDNFIEFFLEINKNFDCQINRLGLNTADILSKDKTYEIIQKYNDLNKIVGYYNNKESNEWSQRLVFVNQNDKLKEEMNYITTISRTKGRFAKGTKMISFDGILLEFDINTIQTKLDFRFDEKLVKLFLQEAFKIKNEIEETI